MTDDKKSSGQAAVLAARRTAWVAGVFCVLVSILLAVNQSRLRVADPLDSPELIELKAALQESPGDDILKERIRVIDRELREEYLSRRSFGSIGTWLLLGGAIVLAAAVTVKVSLEKKVPMPEKTSTEPGTEARTRAAGRQTVAALAVVLFGSSLALAFLSKGVMDEVAEQAEPSYPSMEEVERQWSRFRGPGGLGITEDADIPLTWNIEQEDKVLWKSEVPLRAPNSPVVWGNRVFLTGATKDKREIYCYNAETGRIMWTGRVDDVPGSSPKAPRVMDDSYYAIPTAVTDGQRVYAMFANGDIAAFDYEGNRVWARSLGLPQNDYGHSASLTMYRYMLIVLFDQGYEEDRKSRLMALNIISGNTMWETRRPVGSTWGSPIVIHTQQSDQIIASGNPFVVGYDAPTGKELWRADILRGEIAPSPVFAAGKVFVANAGSVAAAIDPSGRGDITKSHVLWQAEDNLPDICSPLATDDLVFLLTTDGVLTCYDAADGKKVWEQELEMTCNTSPSLVGDRLFIIDEKGRAVVCGSGREFKELGRSKLGEKCYASPAFAGGRMYIRGVKHLFCIGEK